MVPTHRCQRCGRSCEGSRVVPVDAAEADRVEALARSLGVSAPLDGGALRRNMGRCCLWSDAVGCRLHDAFGAEAKPHVCRQFPFVAAGGEVALDPTCPHPVPGEPPTVALRGVASLRPPLPDDLVGLLAHAELTLPEVGARWRAHPWGPWGEVADLGPQLRRSLPVLRDLPLPLEVPVWPGGMERVQVAWRFRLVAEAALEDLVSGLVMVAGAEARDRLLAAWIKLLR